MSTNTIDTTDVMAFKAPLLNASEVATLPMTRERAEKITEQIRKTAQTFVNAGNKLTALIQQAKQDEAWVALGFKSWQAYITDTFSAAALPRMATEDRDNLIGVLSKEGMSTRAIAAVTGESQSTVTRSVQKVAGEPDAVQAAKVSHGLDGKTRKHAKKARKPAKQSAVVSGAVSRVVAGLALTPEIADLDDSITPGKAAELAEALAKAETEIHRLAILLRKRGRKAGK